MAHGVALVDAQVKEMRETYKTCLEEREGLAQFLG